MEILRKPIVASIVAALITYIYLYIKNQVNDEYMTNSDYMKPAVLNAIMVYMIVYFGASRPVIPIIPY
jgi:predicted nucleotide-binding protein (sugar kinase/HSP70/actin superfamily)